MPQKTQIMEVCKCENCGNEANMTITCELVPVDDAGKEEGVTQRQRRTYTCPDCGEETETMVDL